VGLLAAAGQRRQAVGGRRGRLVVAALPQRQLGPGGGQPVGPLGVELGAAGPGGLRLGLLERAVGTGGVATSDRQPGPADPHVDSEGTGALVALQSGPEMAVGVFPAAEQELHTGAWKVPLSCHDEPSRRLTSALSSATASASSSRPAASLLSTSRRLAQPNPSTSSCSAAMWRASLRMASPSSSSASATVVPSWARALPSSRLAPARRAVSSASSPPGGPRRLPRSA
jgi:hypothetical protein